MTALADQEFNTVLGVLSLVSLSFFFPFSSLLFSLFSSLFSLLSFDSRLGSPPPYISFLST